MMKVFVNNSPISANSMSKFQVKVENLQIKKVQMNKKVNQKVPRELEQIDFDKISDHPQLRNYELVKLNGSLGESNY